jgi:hypothetical protein
MKKTSLSLLEQDSIDHIMDNFDFERVHKAMAALDWKWGNFIDSESYRIPDLCELRQAARMMLREAVLRPETGYTTTCGGFCVQKIDGEELRLSFVLDAWSADLTTGECPF